MSVFVIAEAGVNHNGDPEMARKLIDVAASAGADAVKFQTFTAGDVAIAAAPKAQYQKETTDAEETQLDMIRKMELSPEVHRGLVAYCREKAIEFLSSPFDVGSLDFLAGELRLSTLKIPSGEITHGPLLLRAGQSGCNVILSTGMSTLEDIERALGVLAFGFTECDATPGPQVFVDAFTSAAGQNLLRQRVTLLHCTTAYPTPFGDVNLKAMASMAEAFDLPVGYSDHTPGIAVPAAAVAMGACVIEKHFTMDRTLPGPDHKASLEPGELTAMVAAVRAVEEALGDGVKEPAPSERQNKNVARKSLVTLKPVKAGEAFTEENLGVKRPGTGVSPMEYWRWLGREATRDLPVDSVI